MKRYLICLGFVFYSFLPLHSQAQTKDTLFIEDCYKILSSNWPTSKNITLVQEASELKTKNINSAYLPQVGINAQATYQSQVIEVNLPIPGFTIPSPSKDQYKATLDVSQIIFDGGVTNQRKKIENTGLNVEKQQIAVEINQRKEQINMFFFNALLMQENEKMLHTFFNKIEEKISVVKSGVENGILIESDLFLLQAELLKIEQQITDIKYSKESIITSLGLLIGQEIPKNIELGFRKVPVSMNDTISRPEIELFRLQQSRLDATAGISKKSLVPKLIGFGQAGYGRPGLNMLSNNFDKYYIVGAKLSWAPWDWSQSSRDRKIVDIQKEIINNQKDAFIKGVSIQSQNEIGNMNKLEEMLTKDIEIIQLREKITLSSSSKLHNGTIRSSDYIDDITNETQARIDMKRHEIQLMLAKFNYMVIKGLL